MGHAWVAALKLAAQECEEIPDDQTEPDEDSDAEEEEADDSDDEVESAAEPPATVDTLVGKIMKMPKDAVREVAAKLTLQLDDGPPEGPDRFGVIQLEACLRSPVREGHVLRSMVCKAGPNTT